VSALRTFFGLLLGLALLVPGPSLAQEEGSDEDDSEATDPVGRVKEEPQATTDPTSEPVTKKAPAALTFLNETLRWRGYYENQLSIYRLPRNEHADPDGWPVDMMDYNKAKLGIRFKPTRGFMVQVDLVARSFHGQSTFHLADMLPERFEGTLLALEAWDPSAVLFTLENEIYLENAFLSAQAGRFRVRVGKQPIRFGSGYLWNPSDPFNVIDMLDPSYEKQGVTALRLQLHLPHEFLLEAYALPDPFGTDVKFEDSAVAARARAAFGQFMLAAHWATMMDVAGVDLTTMDPDEFTLRSRRHLVGMEFVGEIGGVGFWLEGAYNHMPRDDWSDIEAIGTCWWFEALGGISYTFPGGFMAMAEYLYNGRGANDPEDISLYQWYAYLEQRLRNLNQHQAALTLQLPISQAFTTIGLTALVTPADPAFVLNPSIQFNWSQHLSVMLYGAISYARDPDAEYGAVGQGVYLRFRLSF